MIESIDHINLVVGDLERSVRFYVDLLGFKEVRRARLEGDWIEAVVGLADVCADLVYIEAPDGGLRIELLEYRSPPGAMIPENALPNTLGMRHLAFRVRDMDAVYERLRAAGVAFINPPTSVDGRVVQHEAGRKTLCYFHDPDGVILELAEYT